MQVQFAKQGYAVTPPLLTPSDITRLAVDIEAATGGRPLHAIRHFFREVPQAQWILQQASLKEILSNFYPGREPFLTKAIYFDKPPAANWVVNWHQDLTISVEGAKAGGEVPAFSHWLKKNGYHIVQPPIELLQQTLTLRLHLDDTDARNGALNVIPGSHNRGIIPEAELKNLLEGSTPATVAVPAGSAMLMRPLLLHSSRRSGESLQRRVLHLEFNTMELPAGLQWAERL